MLSVIALEGPSYSGKTTLRRAIEMAFPIGAICVVPEYVEVAGGSSHIPPAPAESTEQELCDLQFFLELDQFRWKRSRGAAPTATLALLDRSIHTLLAHRYAISVISRTPTLFLHACQAASSGLAIWPDAIIYLDTPTDLLVQRRASRTDYCRPLFKCDSYNACFRDYFLPGLRYGKSTVHVLNGGLPLELLVEQAKLAMQ